MAVRRLFLSVALASAMAPVGGAALAQQSTHCDPYGDGVCVSDAQATANCGRDAATKAKLLNPRAEYRRVGKVRTRTVLMDVAVQDVSTGYGWLSCDAFGTWSVQVSTKLENSQGRMERNSVLVVLDERDRHASRYEFQVFYDNFPIQTGKRYTCAPGRDKRDWGIEVVATWTPTDGKPKSHRRPLFRVERAKSWETKALANLHGRRNHIC